MCDKSNIKCRDKEIDDKIIRPMGENKKLKIKKKGTIKLILTQL